LPEEEWRRGRGGEERPGEELENKCFPSGNLPLVKNGTEQGILLESPIEGKKGVLRKEQTSGVISHAFKVPFLNIAKHLLSELP
jgi:hypothetical protein